MQVFGGCIVRLGFVPGVEHGIINAHLASPAMRFRPYPSIRRWIWRGHSNGVECPSPPQPPSTLRLPLEARSDEHTSELQSLMRISYAVFCLNQKILRIKPIKTR